MPGRWQTATESATSTTLSVATSTTTVVTTASSDRAVMTHCPASGNGPAVVNGHTAATPTAISSTSATVGLAASTATVGAGHIHDVATSAGHCYAFTASAGHCHAFTTSASYPACCICQLVLYTDHLQVYNKNIYRERLCYIGEMVPVTSRACGNWTASNNEKWELLCDQ